MLPQHITRLHKKSSSEEDEEVKPSGSDELDKDALLFSDPHQAYKPEYLEMPIKVEGDMRHRHKVKERNKKLHESSIESSEQLEQSLEEE